MKIKETIRNDGLRIISCYVPRKKTVQVELVARVGYAYDPPGKQGLFHCFEHMALKGTKKRSLKKLQSFSRENLFGCNALTGALNTTYKATVIDRKLPLACDYLCDIYFNSIFPATELEREKKSILLEIARYKDNDVVLAYQVLREHLYQENPLRIAGEGTTEGIRKIKRSDLIEQKKRWHIPSNTIAIAIGNVKHNDFVNQISKHIPHNYKRLSLKEWSDESERLPLQKEVVVTRPERKKSILLIGCKMPKIIDDRAHEAFSILNKLIGGQPNSRLWNEIREKRGLAYVIESSYSGEPELGYIFSVYAEIDPSKRKKVEKILWQSLLRPFSEKKEFEGLRRKKFDAFEVVKAEHLGDYKSCIWRKIVEGKSVKSVEHDDEKRLKIIADFSLKDIEKARKEYIRPERFATVIVQPRQS